MFLAALKFEVLLVLVLEANLCNSMSTGHHGQGQFPTKVEDRVHGDYYLLDDIMISEEDADDIMQQRKMVQTLALWPRNIPFLFDPKPEKPYSKEHYQFAMDTLMTHTCLVFTEIPEPADNNGPTYLKLGRTEKGGCSSFVGLTFKSGAQLVNNNCGPNGAVHELGHALGFYHEHCRSDRDDYVKVLFQNMNKSGYGNYQKKNTENHGIPYDYASIMHYVGYGWSIDNNPTLVPLNPLFNYVLEASKPLSYMDVKQLNAAYKCIEDWTKQCGGDPCKNQGYIRDYSGTCKCVCPPGSRGENCEIQDMTYYEAMILKYAGPTTKKITEPGKVGTKKPFTMETHTKWIVAPECKRVVLTFTEFELQNYHDKKGNCMHDKFQIKLEIAKVQNFCSKDIKPGQKFVSKQGDIVINMHTDGHTPGYSADITFEGIPNCR